MNIRWLLGVCCILGVGGTLLFSGAFTKPEPAERAIVPDPDLPAGKASATFGNGCFWCTEAVFQQLRGVESVVSGYTGGSVKDPTYNQVCTGTTGHAEAVRVTYDPNVLTYDGLLEVFWKTHDPTTRDRQGADVGPQYRSVIFYHSDEQKGLAQGYKGKLEAANAFGAPIVTQIIPAAVFYRAEADHQNFFEANPSNRYCRLVIGPKLEKLRQVFQAKLK